MFTKRDEVAGPAVGGGQTDISRGITSSSKEIEISFILH